MDVIATLTAYRDDLAGEAGSLSSSIASAEQRLDVVEGELERANAALAVLGTEKPKRSLRRR